MFSATRDAHVVKEQAVAIPEANRHHIAKSKNRALHYGNFGRGLGHFASMIDIRLCK